MEYYSDMRQKDILSFAATWMDIEIIILNDVSHKEKNKYHIYHLYV